MRSKSILLLIPTTALIVGALLAPAQAQSDEKAPCRPKSFLSLLGGNTTINLGNLGTLSLRLFGDGKSERCPADQPPKDTKPGDETPIDNSSGNEPETEGSNSPADDPQSDNSRPDDGQLLNSEQATNGSVWTELDKSSPEIDVDNLKLIPKSGS